MATATAPSASSKSSQASQQATANRQISQYIRKVGLERMIPLPAVNLSAAQAAGTAPVNIQPQAVGLLKKFIVEITGTANNTDAANVADLSDIGLANLLASPAGCILLDTQSNTRISTSGWHLDFLFRAKHRHSAVESLLATAEIDSGNYGNNFGVVVAPTGFAHATSQPFRAVFEVPVCYSDEDLRGAIYLGTLNAPAQLTLQLTTAPFAAAGVDSTLSSWKGAAGNLTNVTIQVYQVFLDQIPRGNGGVPLLPPVDLSTVYELKTTTNPTAFLVGSDNPLSYTNLRRFMSTCVIYNDNPAADAGRAGGTDINYFLLQVANFTNIWKKFPLQVAREARVLCRKDFPPGCYYFSHRKAPIDTVSYGNTQLITNPSVAAAGAYMQVGWEDFAALNALSQGGSLA